MLSRMMKPLSSLLLFVFSSVFLVTYTEKIIKKESLKTADSDMKQLIVFVKSFIELKIKRLSQSKVVNT
jgi:hypothetical protein